MAQMINICVKFNEIRPCTFREITTRVKNERTNKLARSKYIPVEVEIFSYRKHSFFSLLSFRFFRHPAVDDEDVRMSQFIAIFICQADYAIDCSLQGHAHVCQGFLNVIYPVSSGLFSLIFPLLFSSALLCVGLIDHLSVN